MKRSIIWFFTLLMGIFTQIGYAQPTDLFSDLMNTGPSIAIDAKGNLDLFLDNLKIKRTRIKSDELFLRLAFKNAHREYLKSYSAYTSFPELFQQGKYDCLTATSLFSLVLNHFGFDYEIIATNYHIFLLVETGNGKILIESTDRLNGFVSDQELIAQRVSEYKKNQPALAAEKDRVLYRFEVHLFENIQPGQLAGLLYFNQAVVAFNENKLRESALLLSKTIRTSRTARIKEFAVLLVNAIVASDLPDSMKKDLIRPITPALQLTSPIIASR
jgi:hypothetical protein